MFHVRVLLGQTSLNYQNNQLKYIDRVKIHPEYAFHIVNNNRERNIALLHLIEPIVFNKYIYNINIIRDNFLGPGNFVSLFGWNENPWVMNLFT